MAEKCHPALKASGGRAAPDAATLSYEFKPGHIIPDHFHPEDQLVFASEGVMTVNTEEGTWVVPPMRAVWIPSGVPHSIQISGTASMRTIYIRSGMIRKPGRRCVVINVSPLLRELILHSCTFGTLSKRVSAERRTLEMLGDQLKSAQRSDCNCRTHRIRGQKG